MSAIMCALDNSARGIQTTRDDDERVRYIPIIIILTHANCRLPSRIYTAFLSASNLHQIDLLWRRDTCNYENDSVEIVASLASAYPRLPASAAVGACPSSSTAHTAAAALVIYN